LTAKGRSSAGRSSLGTEQQSVTYYEFLRVSPTATTEVIRAAYRARIRACHPDRSRSPNAHEMATLINEAWHVLGDPERRRLYDASLASPEDPGVPPSPDPVENSVPSVRFLWTCSRCGRRVPRYVDFCRCGQKRPGSTNPAHPTRPDQGGMRHEHGLSLIMIAALSVPLGLGVGLLIQLGERVAAADPNVAAWLIQLGEGMEAAGVGWSHVVFLLSALVLFPAFYCSVRGSVAVATGGRGFGVVVVSVCALVTVVVCKTFVPGVRVEMWWSLGLAIVLAYMMDACRDLHDGSFGAKRHHYGLGLIMIVTLSVLSALGLGLLLQLGERMAAAGVGWFVVVALPCACVLRWAFVCSLVGSVAVAGGGRGFCVVVVSVHVFVTMLVFRLTDLTNWHPPPKSWEELYPLSLIAWSALSGWVGGARAAWNYEQVRADSGSFGD
jgi:hypothetical protein